MHELSLAEAVVAIAERHARGRRVSRAGIEHVLLGAIPGIPKGWTSCATGS